MESQSAVADALAAAGAAGRAGAARAGGASARVLAALHNASASSGVSFDAMAATAKIESGFNATAKAAGSSATGLFQFVDQTWLATVKRTGAEHGLAAQASAIVRRDGQYTVEDPAMRQEILGLRNDPDVSAAMAGEHLKDLSTTLAKTLGRAPDATETYMGHFLGAGGAGQMLHALQANPDAPASSVLPEAARANPSMFKGLSVSQFVDKVRGRVEQAYADLNLPAPKGGLQLAAAGKGGDGGDGAATDLDGWGKGGPRHMGGASERLMLASLAQVFTRIDKSMHGHRAGGALPRGAMQSLGAGTQGI